MWKVFFPFLAALLSLGICQRLVGGTKKIEDADNDEGFQRALKFAVDQHNNGTNDTALYQVLKVVSAQHQVVSGSRYIMTVIMARTNCEKEAPAENCGVHTQPGYAQPYQCTFDVWSQPWLSRTELTKEECGHIQPDSD